MLNAISAFFIFLFAITSLAYSISRSPRPQVGEKPDSAITPSNPSGPKPRNQEEEPYRGPPTGWDEGRVIVETEKQKPQHEEKVEKK